VWSPYYDNSYNLFNITADKPKVLYIKVIPSKPNTIGTYKLSANITRNTISNVEDQLVSGCKFISLSDGFTIITDGNTIINNFSIYSQNGKLHSTYNKVDKEITIHNLPSGLYHVQINTNNGSWKEQILSIQ
jgi:archaellum component FlaG (FlaF/FlaG flagellin family)